MSDEQEPWDDAWWEEDTTPSKIEAALREMLYRYLFPGEEVSEPAPRRERRKR